MRFNFFFRIFFFLLWEPKAQKMFLENFGGKLFIFLKPHGHQVALLPSPGPSTEKTP